VTLELLFVVGFLLAPVVVGSITAIKKYIKSNENATKNVILK
jgi:hypothetical protein